MCGIVGIVASQTNGFSNDEANVFSDMLFVDTLRGVDSTGVFSVNKHNNVTIHKAAINGLDFIQTDEYVAFKTKLWRDGLFCVGHNRAATRGTVTDKNAHPFWVKDKIILVQNGTYRGSHKHLKDTEVDTEAVAHVLDEEKDVETALQKINAAYALVWYNTETRELSIIRNNERPLFLAKSKNGTVLFASEFATIAWACHRNNLVFEEKPQLMPINTLITYANSGDGQYTTKSSPIKCDYVPPPTENYPFRNAYGMVGNGWEDDGMVEHHWTLHRNRNHSQVPALVSPVANPSYMVTTLSEYAMKNLPEYHMTPNDTKEFEERIRKHLYGTGSDMPIELIDYFPSNSHKNCSTFIVYGKLVDPLLGDGPQPLYHWIEYNKTEMEMLDFITDQPFYTVRVMSPMATYFVSDVSKERKGVVTCFVSVKIPVLAAVAADSQAY
jgi:hypothetical protein